IKALLCESCRRVQISSHAADEEGGGSVDDDEFARFVAARALYHCANRLRVGFRIAAAQVRDFCALKSEIFGRDLESFDAALMSFRHEGFTRERDFIQTVRAVNDPGVLCAECDEHTRERLDQRLMPD